MEVYRFSASVKTSMSVLIETDGQFVVVHYMYMLVYLLGGEALSLTQDALHLW